jgi:type VI secretion system protein ImpE
VTDARTLLSGADLDGALKALQAEVRSKPSDAKLRTFLFQLHAVRGEWKKALAQLQVCGELDASTLAMVNTYTPAIQCEAVREAVFAAKTLPHVFGPPAEWVALLVQALRHEVDGQHDQAAGLRAQALDQAPTSSGVMDGQPFQWIADADSRLGPILEVVINGRYGWLPFMHLSKLRIEPVVDLRDLIWAPAQIQFTNGGEAVTLLPARYPGTASEGADGALLMARKTEWIEVGSAQYHGRGQRLLSTDADEVGLLQVRDLTFNPG